MKNKKDAKNKLIPSLPSGVKDILPIEARELKLIKKRLAKQYEAWGYDEIYTPVFEYLDVSALQSGERIQKEMFKFLDDRGDLLALRPDMTTSIARLVSQKMAQKKAPIRLYYQANVFRQQKPLQAQPREFWQSGVEIMGGATVTSDSEILMLLIDSLKSLGLRDFKIGLGNVEHVKMALDSLPDQGIELKKYLVQKNMVAAMQILGSYKSKAADGLKELIQLQGPKVIEKASKFVEGKTSKAFVEITELSRLLKELGYEDYITYDFSLVPDFDYYTGLVFEVYVPGVGLPIASGGRYDNLLPSFGQPITAAGFAIGLERLHLALVAQKSIASEKKTRLILQGMPSANMYKLADEIRQKNKIVKLYMGECEDIERLMVDWEAKWLVKYERGSVFITGNKEKKKISLASFKKWVQNA